MKDEKLGQEPAFPLDYESMKDIQNGYGTDKYSLGVSKRFYAACAAMQGMLANPKQSKHKSNLFIRLIQLFNTKTNLTWCNSNYDELITEAYTLADELFKTRKPMKQKPTIAIPPEGCESYLTAGKEYEIIKWDGDDYFLIDSDIVSEPIYTNVKESAHLNGKDWILK